MCVAEREVLVDPWECELHMTRAGLNARRFIRSVKQLSLESRDAADGGGCPALTKIISQVSLHSSK